MRGGVGAGDGVYARVAMPRRPRRDYEGAFHHITSRGVRKLPLYLDDVDFERFLACLGLVVARFRWTCITYCLMPNHYHLELVTNEDTLIRGMHALNSSFAQWFNRRHGTCGHVFEARYHAKAIERESHLLATCRYVMLNPVRAGLVERPEDWRWSSFRAAVGLEAAPRFLALPWLLRLFAPDPFAARARLAHFVASA